MVLPRTLLPCFPMRSPSADALRCTISSELHKEMEGKQNNSISLSRPMITDPLFYRLFETSPETFFLLIGMSAESAKEMAVRIISIRPSNSKRLLTELMAYSCQMSQDCRCTFWKSSFTTCQACSRIC